MAAPTPRTPSGGYRVARTLASALYLLLFRILHRQHARAFTLLNSCVTDAPLSPLESAILREVVGALFDGEMVTPALRVEGFRFTSTTDF